jgi:hypothetical protein
MCGSKAADWMANLWFADYVKKVRRPWQDRQTLARSAANTLHADSVSPSCLWLSHPSQKP